MNGSGREMRMLADGVDRRFRCKSATRDGDDQVHMMASSDALLTVEDDDALYPVEAWVFGWVASRPTQLDEIFVSPIFDFIDGNPGHLVLGAPISLLGAGPAPSGGGFKPTTEGLLGFDDEDSSSAGSAGSA